MKIELLDYAIKNTLEELVHKRFKDITELKNYLEIRFKGFNIELIDKDMSDIDKSIDYDFIGSVQNMYLDILCDFDIYYAKTRNNEIYITEVGYEFE